MYKQTFINRLGQPLDESKLDMYLELCSVDYSGDDYSERHHVLPRCEFPEFADDKNNIVTLRYPDHVQAHVLLFEAYPTRKFQNPLRFMGENKSGELVSEAAKSAWLKFKNTERFKNWSRKRSEHMERRWRVDEYRTFMSEMSRMTGARTEVKTAKSDAAKAMWGSQREQIVKTMLVSFNDPDLKERRRVTTTERYLDPEFKARFDETMTCVNKDTDKRARAGTKIKSLWEDEEHRKKTIESRIGIYWWNDGVTQVKSRECPDGFVRGRLKTPNLGRKKKVENATN